MTQTIHAVLNKWIVAILISITLFGFIVRIYNVDKNPAGFFTDEASIGFNGYHLLNYGTDEHSENFPVFFRSFGDYRPPIPFYAVIPFVALFGLHEFSVRLATVLVGTATIPIFYLFVYLLARTELNKNYSITLALIASSILSISPWHIHFSRFGSEYVYLPFFIILSLTALMVGLHQPIFLLLSALCMGLISYTYLPGIVVGPICMIIISILCFPIFKKYSWFSISALSIYIVLMIPVTASLGNGTLLTRWNNVGLSHVQDPINQGKIFAKQYIQHFSPAFLFTQGDIDFPGHFIRRFSPKGLGELYIVEAPFILLGAFTLLTFVVKKNFYATLPFVLLFLYPIGSSITTTDGGGPLAFRSILGSVVFPLFSAFGIYTFAVWLRSKKYIVCFALCTFLAFGILFTRYEYIYQVQYPLYSQDFWGWQFGPRDIMKYFLANSSLYDELIIIGDFNSPDMFIRFYDPQNVCQNKCKVGNFTSIDTSKHQLVALQANMLLQVAPYQLHTHKIIYYPNGTEAFYIGTFSK